VLGEQMASRYGKISLAQQILLLDAFVELTEYACKYALNGYSSSLLFQHKKNLAVRSQDALAAGS
jgi:hypothetical protein